MKEFFKNFDYLLALAVMALCAFGVLMIYSSANAHATPISRQLIDGGFWRSQLLFVVTGTVLMLAFSVIDYRFITRFYLYIYALMLVLLVLVLIIGGDDGTGVTRWFRIENLPVVGTIGIQPSEFAKVFIILFLAKLLDVKQERFNHIGWLAVIFLAVGVTLTLVMWQRALSATMVILVISLVVVFTAGLYYRTIFIGLLILLPIAAFIWLDIQRADPLFIHRILEPYQMLRIRTALDPYAASPDDMLQLEGSLYAIGTGGLTGRGFLNNPHVIFGHNDFIFAVIASQFGFAGASVVLGVLAFIIIKCIFIALRAEDVTGRLIAAGVAGMLIFETFVHVGVGVGLLPVTGMPLPFLSSGGSMIWGHMMAMGLVLNISLPREKPFFYENTL